ncbi:MAG: hypothetical protein JXM73_04005 [Anaerolineae bacterium]|nr:hypothetical protein [Anaerolineae bacterium]
MLDSIPVPVQAVLWPLLGAVVILGLRRWLPNWLQRAISAAAAAASLAILWPQSGDAPPAIVDLTWGSLDFFRMGLAFYPHGLSTLAGIALAGVTAAAALGISPNSVNVAKTHWHGLLLVALAGCLAAILASNLLTLALGSGLLTLAVTALAAAGASSGDEHAWPPLATAAPGAAATLLIYLSALQMDAQIGHASLQGRAFSTSALALLATAAVLWLLSFPLRAANKPQGIVSFLLPCGVGLYLLARVLAIAPALSSRPWLLIAGGAMLLVGGVLAWLDGAWPGIAIHQAGYGLAFIALWGGQASAAQPPLPWPLAGLTLALGVLAVSASAGNGASSTGGQAPAYRWAGLSWLAQWTGLAWLARQVGPWWAKVRSYITSHLGFKRPRFTALGRLLAVLLPSLALASLAGLPLTVGAVSRWHLYGAILGQGQAALLLIILVSDSLLIAGLWAVLRALFDHRDSPLSVARVAAMIALGLALVMWGVTPGHLSTTVVLGPVQSPGVSTWGIGLLYVLPWLVGTWLAYAGARRPAYVDLLRRIARRCRVGRLYQAVAWASAQLAGAVYWFGQVGEGGGWWGWALIVLAVGLLLSVAR